MKALFSAAGLKALRSWCRPDTLFAFDFDGTLAPIVSDPNRARMNEATVLLLKRLRKRGIVAVISGRELRNLRARIRGLRLILIGNHGIEGNALSPATSKRLRGTRTQWKKKFLQMARNDAILSRDCELEDKSHSLSVHYRNARNKSRAKQQLMTWVATLTPRPRIVGGKCVINLIPSGAPDKGQALLKLMKRTKTQRALFVGDDDTDEDVFSLRNKRILTVRIGRKAGSAARFYVSGQQQILRLLALVAAELK